MSRYYFLFPYATFELKPFGKLKYQKIWLADSPRLGSDTVRTEVGSWKRKNDTLYLNFLIDYPEHWFAFSRTKKYDTLIIGNEFCTNYYKKIKP